MDELLAFGCYLMCVLNVAMAKDVYDIIFAGVILVVIKLAYEMHALNEEMDR